MYCLFIYILFINVLLYICLNFILAHCTVSLGVVRLENATTYYYHINWGTFQTVRGALTWTYYKRYAGMPNS